MNSFGVQWLIFCGKQLAQYIFLADYIIQKLPEVKFLKLEVGASDIIGSVKEKMKVEFDMIPALKCLTFLGTETAELDACAITQEIIKSVHFYWIAQLSSFIGLSRSRIWCETGRSSFTEDHAGMFRDSIPIRDPESKDVQPVQQAVARMAKKSFVYAIFAKQYDLQFSLTDHQKGLIKEWKR